MADMVHTSPTKLLPIKIILVSEVKESGFNPASRTDIRPDDELLASIRDWGYRPEYPVIIGRDGRLGDGHRRLMVCRMLGIDHVPAMFSDLTAEELMAYNAGQKRITDAQWVEMARENVEPPNRIKRYRKLLVEMAGPEAEDLLVQYRKSPRVVLALRQLMRYLGKDDQSTDYGYRVIDWMLRHNSIRRVEEAIRDNVAPEVISLAITQDKSLQRGAWTIAGG